MSHNGLSAQSRSRSVKEWTSAGVRNSAHQIAHAKEAVSAAIKTHMRQQGVDHGAATVQVAHDEIAALGCWWGDG